MKTISKKIKQRIGLHNEFTIAVTEYETEACQKIKKQWEAKAYNVVLNQGIPCAAANFIALSVTSISLARLCRYTGSNGSINDISFGGWIFYGSGDTTPAATDTKLAIPEGSKATTELKGDDKFASGYASYTQYIVLTPSEEIGTVFKEVGLGVSDELHTRALIVDSEGSPLSITKTATMQITIYSKLYFILDTISYANTAWISGLNNNAITHGIANNDLMSYGVGNGNFERWYLYTGTNGQAVDPGDTPVLTQLDKTDSGEIDLIRSGNALSFEHRYETGESNGKIKELGISFMTTYNDGSYHSVERGLLRSVMPVTGVYSGTTFTDVEIGTGDGSEDEFTLGETDQTSTFWTWNEINEANPTVKVDGVTQTAGTDFTYNDSTGVITFESGSIPANGEAVTASWSVPYIAKSNDYVLDVSFEITIGEGTVPS